jgi:hypothetical protein
MRPLLCHLSYAAASVTEQKTYRLTERESSEGRSLSGHCARNCARESACDVLKVAMAPSTGVLLVADAQGLE